ncbi:MAG: hypothetical protein WBD16_00590 [Pyrinomonadaceae bacterium]
MNSTQKEGKPSETQIANSQHLSPPSALTGSLIRYILGFTVSVAVGLAPFLGKFRIPGFDALLTLIPDNLQATLLPLSAALMGMVAVIIQWYGYENKSRRWLRQWFTRTLIIAGLSFLMLFVIHTLVVVKIQILGGKTSATFLVGFSRPNMSPCSAEFSDSECIKFLTLNPAKIESFWGSNQIRIATICLFLPYLIFTSSFGLLIGLVLLRDRLIRTKR